MVSRPHNVERWDEEAFQDLYERTARILWPYVFRMTQNRAVADDILQETYLRFLEAEKSRDLPPEHAKNYLFRIASNLAIDYFKMSRREKSPGEIEPHAGENELNEIFGLLRELKTRDQRLLLLAYVHGFTHREIASVLGYTAGSVRPLLARARDRFAALLDRHGFRMPRRRRGSDDA
jgi:RNA polymerase sigma-70 factor (ECF subfamily)